MLQPLLFQVGRLLRGTGVAEPNLLEANAVTWTNADEVSEKPRGERNILGCPELPHSETWWKVKSLGVHPGRLTWNLQITHLERKMIFQTSMIMFHVNLQGCTSNRSYISTYFFSNRAMFHWTMVFGRKCISQSLSKMRDFKNQQLKRHPFGWEKLTTCGWLNHPSEKYARQIGWTIIKYYMKPPPIHTLPYLSGQKNIREEVLKQDPGIQDGWSLTEELHSISLSSPCSTCQPSPFRVYYP